MERFLDSPSVLGWNDSIGFFFHLRTEEIQWSHSVLGSNDHRVIILSWNRTTPGESFSPGIERLQGSPSVMGWNDSRGFSPGGTTPAEPFCPGMERLYGSLSISGQKNSSGVILSWDRTTLEESFSLGM